MNAATTQIPGEPETTGCASYDPRNLDPIDEQARQLDDISEGIDWDEIIATTQDDWEAGRYKVFKSTDYPTDESLLAAMKSWRDSVLGRDDF